MALTQINNGDSGLVARGKINTAFTTVDNLPLPSSATVQTTNGATTSIASISLGTYSVNSIEASLSAYDTTNNLAYGSQFFNPDSKAPQTPISSKNFLDSVKYRAQDLGRLIGVAAAEGFTVERPVAVEQLDHLI